MSRLQEFQTNCVRLLSGPTTETKATQLTAAALGISGEGGEVADQIKKHLFQGHELNVEKVINELGDVMFYIAVCADAVGTTLEDVISYNIDKLNKRYPAGFSVEASVNRKV